MAIAEAHLGARYNRPGFPVVDHFTYALVSDGDMMEGVASEAASLAGQLKLGKIIYLYDDNRITLSASTRLTFAEDVVKRFDAYGLQTQRVEDGNDLAAIDAAIRGARADEQRPSLIVVRTHIGYGSPHKQDTFEVHGSPLGADEVKLTKQNLGWPTEPDFLVPPEVGVHMRAAESRGDQLEGEWNSHFGGYRNAYPELAEELEARLRGEPPREWESALPHFPADDKGMATRVAGGKVMGALAPKLPGLFGGSGDLDPSTHTMLAGQGDFEHRSTKLGDVQGAAGSEWSYAGRNLHIGVREHAMGAIANGLAAHGGFLPFTSTFLTFSDYMRPAIRLGALMQAKVVHIFAHDSVGLGEDGPTHQPVEHLAALRAIPGLLVIRPADANETVEAWRVAVLEPRRPVAMVLSRQNLPVLDRGSFAAADGLRRGAYVLRDPDGPPQLVLIATGSEVALIVAAELALRQRNLRVRLVSMPSWELFDAQPESYRASVLPPTVPLRIAVEAGITQGWHRYVGQQGEVIGVDHFGASAPGAVVLERYGFSAENVCQRALALLSRTGPDRAPNPFAA